MPNFNKKSLLKPGNYFLISIALFIIYHATPLLATRFSLSSDNFFIQQISNQGGNGAIAFLLLSMTLFFINIWAESFWAEHIKPLLAGYVERIDESTDKAKETIHLFTKEVSASIKGNNLDLAIGQSNHEPAQDRLPAIHERAFGAHCSKEKGFYKHIQNSLGQFLDPRVPHRSEYYQDITITEHDGELVWQEITEYCLHTIALDSEYKTPFDGDIEPYKLVHHTGAMYSDIDKPVLKIYVENSLFISTEGTLTITGGSTPSFISNNENIKIKSNSDGHIDLWIDCEIEINKPMT